MNATTLRILNTTRTQLIKQADTKDLIGLIFGATKSLNVSFGFSWSARDVIARIVFPGYSTETNKDDIILHYWCERHTHKEILDILNRAIDSIT